MKKEKIEREETMKENQKRIFKISKVSSEKNKIQSLIATSAIKK